MKRKVLFNLIIILSLILTSLASLASQGVAASSNLSLSDIIVTGYDAVNLENPRILRVDKDGNLLWDKPIPLQKGGEHQAGDRNLTEDAFYLASWQDEDKINGKHRILKLDENGSLVWDIQLSLDRSIISANPVDGGLYALTGEGLFKIDTDGNVVWGPNNYGYSSGNHMLSTDVTTGGAYLSACSYNKVLKLDKDGNLVWEKAISSPYKVNANPIDGGVYVGSGSYSRDTYRLDGEGNIIWQRSNFPSQYTYGRAVSPVDGSLYIGSGWTHRLARVTMDNTVVFNIGTPDYNANLAANIEDDGVYVGRYAEYGVYKYDGNGTLIWSQTFGPSSWIGYYGIVGVYTGMPSFLLTAVIDVDPDTLNLKSKGKWITAHIELPEGYDVADIDVSTVMLEGTIAAEDAPTEIDDYDNDGIPDLMVKFDMQALIEYLDGTTGKVALAVSGELSDGMTFEGSDNITVINPGKK